MMKLKTEITWVEPEPGEYEAATEYYSPCCKDREVYADFEAGIVVGFRCAGCGKNFESEEDLEP